MKKTDYLSPCLEVETVEVESGYAVSLYGEEGESGQESGYIDYGDDYL